jgi:Ammonium Transporter Family
MGPRLMVEILVQTFLSFLSYLTVNFNLNLWYTTGDVGWIITATALVLFMIPGVGFFYSGLTGTKSALSVIMLTFISLSVVSFQVLLSSIPTEVSVLIYASGSCSATRLFFPKPEPSSSAIWIMSALRVC